MASKPSASWSQSAGDTGSNAGASLLLHSSTARSMTKKETILHDPVGKLRNDICGKPWNYVQYVRTVGNYKISSGQSFGFCYMVTRGRPVIASRLEVLKQCYSS